jgi:hypothetical protein
VKRRLFTVASALSLLLFIATIAIWIRGYSYWDEFDLGIARDHPVSYVVQSVDRQFHFTRICNDRGVWVVRHWRWQSEKYPTWWQSRTRAKTLKPDWGGSRFGFTIGYRTWKGGSAPGAFNGSTFSIGMPLWIVWALFLVAPGLWLARRSWRRNPRGLCRQCGYDLRASKGCCPECGMAIPIKQESADISN